MKCCERREFSIILCSSAPRGYYQHGDSFTCGEFRKEAWIEGLQAPSGLFLLYLWWVSEPGATFPQVHPAWTLLVNLVYLRRSTLIVDPTDEEENLSAARITVVTEEGDRLCAVHKPGQRTDAGSFNHLNICFVLSLSVYLNSNLTCGSCVFHLFLPLEIYFAQIALQQFLLFKIKYIKSQLNVKTAFDDSHVSLYQVGCHCQERSCKSASTEPQGDRKRSRNSLTKSSVVWKCHNNMPQTHPFYLKAVFSLSIYILFFLITIKLLTKNA